MNTTYGQHNPNSYFDSGIGENGRFVLPPGAEFIQALYDHGTGPQITNIIRLSGETDEEAGVAWGAEVSAAWGYPVEVLLATADDAALEVARTAALLADAARSQPT